MSGGVLRAIAPSKVNLYLEIGRTRADGYHDLTTVFQAIDLTDSLFVSPAPVLTLSVIPDLGIPAEENLVHRAASRLASAAGIEPTAAISLEKRIPSGAGLGGGSADAAAALVALDRMWGLGASLDELTEIARALGADVPFFLVGGTALYEGRGDEFASALPHFAAHVAIVKPDTPIPAADAYRAFDADPVSVSGPGRMLDALACGDVVEVAHALENAFTPIAVELVPEVDEALAWTRSCAGVHAACLAGSGSAVFALCDTEAAAQGVADGALERGWWAAAARTCAHGVLVEEVEESR